MIKAIGAAAGKVNSAEAGKGADARQWGILALLTIGVMIAYFDRTSIATAIANPEFVDYFGMSAVDRGWVSAAFFWSFAVVQAPMGWVVDRYGVKWPYAVCFTGWCVATAITGLMHVVWALIMVRLIVGATEAVVLPASYRWIRNNVPERHTGTAIGIFVAGNKVGTAICAPVAAWLIVNYDWRLMFIASGLMGLIWLAPWLGLMKNDLPKPEQMAAAKRRASSVKFSSIMKSPVVWGALIINFCYGYFIFYSMQWMVSYLVEQRGLSLKASGLYTFFSFAGVAIVGVLSGWAADRIIARGADAVITRKVFVVTGFIGSATVLFGAYATDLNWALFWNIFSLSCLGLTTANNLALCKVTLIPRQAVGLVVGVQGVASSLSGGFSGALSGWLLHVSGSYLLPMMVIVVFLAIGSAACIFLLRPEWSPKVSEEAAE